MRFVELYAGTAATSLHLQGRRSPVSLSGSKARLAAAMTAHMQTGRCNTIMLCEKDPQRRALLRCYVDDALRLAVCDVLASREEADAEAIWHDGRNIGDPITATQVAATVFALVRTVGGAVRGGFKRCCSSKGTPVWNAWTPQQLAARLRAVRLERATILDDAADAPPSREAIVYLDPPYQRGLGYHHDTPWRPLAATWLDAGAEVYVSEDHPIGAAAIQISPSRIGRGLSRHREEWLTRLSVADLQTNHFTHP